MKISFRGNTATGLQAKKWKGLELLGLYFNESSLRKMAQKSVKSLALLWREGECIEGAIRRAHSDNSEFLI